MWHNTRLLNAVASALYALLALGALGVGAVWLMQRPMFQLQQVRVMPMAGSELRHVNVPSLRANALPKLRGNFFSLNLDDARAAFESVPWVRRASIRRVWPNGLLVEVQEHEALGTWGGNESGKLVNTYGEVFVANLAEAEDDTDLVALAGPEGTEQDVVDKLETMTEWFKPMNVEPLSVTLTDRYAWRARLSNGTVIELGRELNDDDRTALAARARRFVRAWPEVTKRWGGQIEYADLRYPNGFAVRAAGVRFLTDAQAAVLAKGGKLPGTASGTSGAAKPKATLGGKPAANNKATRSTEKTR
ncbi:FtsQ-type POTRA domain-containing protein [Ralstonia pickettii]|uniref:Cell division protein FtsQ n=1 Tax=Ralstonia pickettii TaxID=329 RepID=A0A7X2LD82_RALPI|nr:cell division protein FtsQ/DivIB [Ralstonia pickettii]MRT01526.1 FtsQ-type POTRA domain-containing protein [Ralstonia pickettii]